jgi:hypothetical protein
MTTYTQLKADFMAWSARTDIEAKIPTMCALFEARVNRGLRVRQMEASFTGTPVANVLPLPAGWLQWKRLWPDAYADCPLQPQTLDIVYERTQGVPTHYAVDGTNVRFNGVGAVSGVYYQGVPSLVTNETNWLSVLAYDAYLFGVLAEVSTYIMDDAELAKHYARSQAVLDDVASADKRHFGPLRSVAR